MHIIEEEHERFHRRVAELINSETKCWKYLVELLKTMENHEKLEEDILIPLLNFMESRLHENNEFNTSALANTYRKFLEHYDGLISEHLSMKKLLKDVKGETYLVEVSDFIDNILQHIRMEEEIAYPAAFAAGELLNIDRTESGETRTASGNSKLP